MDFKKRLIQIRDFLEPYQNIWQNEIMLMYPDPFLGYPPEWLNELMQFRIKEDVIRIEKKEVYDYIKLPGLVEYYRKIDELIVIPSKDDLLPMNEAQGSWLYMTPKKAHEIRRLAPYVGQICHSQGVNKVIDIGGGIGLLAQTLSTQLKLQVSSIDMDPVLQKTGSRRYPKNLVNYLNHKVESGSAFESVLDPQSVSVGLHTCGGLAVDILRTTSKKRVQGIINFGCCYNKLEGKENVQNISLFAQNFGRIELSKYALTLASRAHRKMNEKDYILKQKVKFFRYAFHILLKDKYKIKEEVFLGNSHRNLYNESFSTYAKEQFTRTSIKLIHSDQELEDFFASQEITLLVEKMIVAGHIRNALGRVLELYLILDRAIYLEENGYVVEIAAFFDEEFSPRNIGITGTLKAKTK